MIFCQILGIVFYGRKTMKYSLDTRYSPMRRLGPVLVISGQQTRPQSFMKYTLDKQMGVKRVETLRPCIILIITGETQLQLNPNYNLDQVHQSSEYSRSPTIQN